ncbi:MAG: response regulator [Chloroflexota bacterium]|nr:response regulator [Chloroflexota bacterium]
MIEEDTIKVIIVDDVAETRENIRKLLQFESDLEIAGVAATGREGIQLARDTSPDVVIMDINMPDMDGITAAEIIRKELPSIQIIVLSVQGDPNYMRKAMLAGVRDFLTKPPIVDEMIHAVRRAGELAKEERKKMDERYPADAGTHAAGDGHSRSAMSYGKVVAVYSPKGGVGCTTLATNLAITLHSEETPVVLVDAKLQFGDVSVMLNERARNSIVDLAPRSSELDPDIVEDVLITHNSSGIKLLAAPSRPEYAENITGEQFRDILAYLRRLYAYIIVDTSSYLSDVVISAIDVSSIVILIATQNIPSINNVRLFLDLSNTLGFERERILFVLNHYDKRIAITSDAVGENLSKEISVVIPKDERVVVPSVNRGIPFVMNTKKHAVSQAILELAETVRYRLSEIDAARDVVNM